MGAQRGFDFTQLDAEAAQLHLPVTAAEEVEVAVCQETRPVSRAVHAGAGRGAEGVRDEALGGELRAAQVAASHALATDEQLANDADGHRLELSVEDVQRGVGDGPADGDDAVDDAALIQVVDGAADDSLGGAVLVDEADARREALPAFHGCGRQGFAADDEGALQPGQLLRQHQVQQHLEVGGGELDEAMAVLPQRVGEGLQLTRGRQQVHFPASQ